MSIREWILTLVITANCTLGAWSQTCTNPMKTLSFDTVFTGSGNAVSTLTFPKFDPLMGTLMSVQFQSEITLLYGYELENRDSITVNNYKVKVYREDEVSGTALLSPLMFLYSRTYGPFTLSAGDGQSGTGPDYMSAGPLFVMNRQKFMSTVYNTADYLGTGTLDFDYTSNTYSSILGSVNYAFNATANDTIRFRITYSYCSNIFLKADLTYFQVLRKDDGHSRLVWQVDNEETGRRYDIQGSPDGKNFQSLGMLKSLPDLQQKGSYSFISDLTPYKNNRMVFYRIRQTDLDGTVKYSAIQSLTMETGNLPRFHMFPNPATTFTQVTINQEKYGNWLVELYALSGEVLSRQVFNRTRSFRVETPLQLPRGMYLLKITDTDTRISHQQRLLVQ